MENEKLEINLTAAGGKETVTPVAVGEPESADQIIVPVANGSGNGTGVSTVGKSTVEATSDAPAWDTCGFLMIRNGTCYKCLNCGSTTGCSRDSWSFAVGNKAFLVCNPQLILESPQAARLPRM